MRQRFRGGRTGRPGYRGSLDFLNRFWQRVAVGEPDACWPWLGAIDERPDRGYGVVGVRGRPMGAHRLAYILTHGVDLDSEVCVCHRCDNRPCCNPAHHFPGSIADNIRDARAKGRHHNARLTHCPSGHPYAGDNLFFDPTSGARRCRSCTRKLARANRERRRERAMQRGAA